MSQIKRHRGWIRVLFAFLLCSLSETSASYASATSIDSTLKVEVLWHESLPFIYQNKDGSLGGIEAQILEEFQLYMQNIEQVSVEYSYNEVDHFKDIIPEIGASKGNLHRLGVSAISITDERMQKVDFSHAYFPDLTVFVSSPNSPILRGLDEFPLKFEGFKAVTIAETVYDDFLEGLKPLTGNFEVQYIHSNENILEALLNEPKRFGFIDLPIYLEFIEQGELLRRHSILTRRGLGYGVAFPQGSPLSGYFNKFLAHPSSKAQITKIMIDTFGMDTVERLNMLAEEGDIDNSLLEVERSIHQQNLASTSTRLASEIRNRNIILAGTGLLLISLVFIMYLLARQRKVNDQLRERQQQIRQQREEIERNNSVLRNHNRKLTLMSEERSMLFHMLAHDLRAPINNIRGLSSVLIDDPALQSEQKDLVHRIEKVCLRLNELIQRILQTEKEGDFSNEQFHEVNLKECVINIAESFSVALHQKTIDLRYRFPEDICTVQTDYLRLNQALENIISNAVKFTPPSKQIEIGVVCNQEATEVYVKDEGPGFSREDKMHLFEPFSQLSAKPTAGESTTGLGLSIVKRCLDSIGAKLQLETEEGKGSIFRIHIPKVAH